MWARINLIEIFPLSQKFLLWLAWQIKSLRGDIKQQIRVKILWPIYMQVSRKNSGRYSEWGFENFCEWNSVPLHFNATHKIHIEMTTKCDSNVTICFHLPKLGSWPRWKCAGFIHSSAHFPDNYLQTAHSF